MNIFKIAPYFLASCLVLSAVPTIVSAQEGDIIVTGTRPTPDGMTPDMLDDWLAQQNLEDWRNQQADEGRRRAEHEARRRACAQAGARITAVLSDCVADADEFRAGIQRQCPLDGEITIQIPGAASVTVNGRAACMELSVSEFSRRSTRCTADADHRRASMPSYCY